MQPVCDDMYGKMERVFAVARAAGRMILSSVPSVLSFKGTKDNYATTTDVEIQKYLRDELTALVPGSGFLGEENVCRDGGHEFIWIVDPLDGTTNFSRHVPISTVSIALKDKDGVVFGIIYNPYLDELYHAYRGKGAYLNGERIYVSSRPKENSVVSLAWSVYNKKWSHYCFRISERLHDECEDLRRLGSAAYEIALLARGSIDMFFEMRLFPWDYAAGSLLVSEAGGCSSSIDGPVDLDDQSTFLCANTRENLDYLHSVVAEELGGFRISGSIYDTEE